MSFLSSYSKINFRHVKNQFLAVICANLVCLAHGGSMGWLSPSLLVLQSNESPLVSGPINNEVASWVGATTYIGGVFGNFMFMAILKHFGRKKTFCFLALPNLAFWIIVTFAKRIELLYFGRFITGLTGGGTYVCIPLFVAEIADDHIRGILASFLMIFTCFGVMISYIAGTYLTYNTAPFVIMIFPISFIISFLILPESPNDLMNQKRYADAQKSLRFYKNCNEDTKEENERFNKEWEKVKLIAQQSIDRGEKVYFRDYCTREARVGLFKGLSLISLSLFCGSPVFMNYAAIVFKDSGSNLDPSISAIIMIAIQLIATSISSSLVDNIGRRILLIVSSTGTAIGLALMGTYTYLSFHNVDLAGYDWVPVTCISFSVFMAYIGLVPLVIVVLLEVLPVKIRSSGTSYCLSLISLFMFIIVKFYPTLVAIIHMHSCMWIFSAVSLLGVLFGIFVLEETKGKNINVEVIESNLVCLAHGGSLGWLSPSLLVLQSNESPLVIGPVNNEVASWVGATTYIGVFLGNFMFTAILKHFGRKKTFCIIALPNLSFWIIVTFAKRIELLYFGRFISGLTGGGTYVCIPLFVAEIADDHIRGILGSFLMTFICFGVMISYIAGTYLTYSTAPFVFMIFPISFMISFLILPESPNDLMNQKRYADAEKSLRFYKNCNEDTKEENQRFKKEWEKMQLIAQQSIDRGGKVYFKNYCTREARVGLLKGFSLISLSIFCGSPVLMNYAAIIFKDSGSNLDPSISAIIMIGIQLIATSISTSLVDNIGRRILLIVSSTGTAIGLALMGTYTYLSFHNFDLAGYDWVPVTCISFSVFMAYIGLVPLVFVVLMEVLPVKIRLSGSSYCLSLISLFMFIIVKFYPTLVTIIHLHSCMWIFSAVSLLGVLFGLFLLEETKGKNINVEVIER